ncbi:MAG: hypothetical protein OZSIB_1471 [Candidatus Ozemobacter sibiricus]|jgi:phenylacetate-CoA ligase|uniref:Coenzyme F390 synthetase n=1 Tax=Candidatus Ozemobacter sibiricus TaxID=2268124 RepID=A0A367ZKS3_9BACT|nr:MAG: hypothetical protein OZSIB_1471 [Candidatus Ozemobacter sibiricus]
MREPGRLEDLWLTARGIWHHYAFLRHSQWWSTDRLRAYQAELVGQLLIRAYERTDYYREAFWKADFDPYKDFRSLEDLSRVPLLDKETARRAPARLADPNAVDQALELRTSGTTGQVFREYVSKEHWVVEQGVVWRHWSWTGYRFRDPVATVRSYVPKEGEPLWKLDRVRNFMFFSAYHLNPEGAEAYLRQMQQFKPVILRGYPASLYVLARMAERLQLETPPLKAILTGSEMLLPEYREVIERVFRARVFDWYGQAECTCTLNECEAHEGMHINMEYGVCELLPDPRLPPNERRIVATCLHNRAMPLIRYDTGDIAILAERTTCSCGRGLPLVKGIRGRSDDFLYAPDGRIIPSVNLYTVMYKIDEIIAFQLIQDRLDHLEVRLEAKHFPAAVEERLRADLRERFGGGVTIDLRVNEPFIQTADGKKRPVISQVKLAW